MIDRMRMLLPLLCLLAACGGNSSTDVSLIEQADERVAADVERQAERQAKSEAISRRGYIKREGLHIDMPYLGGKRLDELTPDTLADQLGVEISREELPESEEHVVFDKAQVWTYDGRIYRVRKDLAHPMDIPTALGTSGFPLDLGQPVESANEARWNGVWRQRRVRLFKNEKDDRLYDTIEVWRFLPKELF
jgi:hypothetical protein